MNKYTNINKKYLAMALSFLGFNFFQFINDEGKIVYSFENTEEFKMALAKLLELKKECNNYNN